MRSELPIDYTTTTSISSGHVCNSRFNITDFFIRCFVVIDLQLALNVGFKVSATTVTVPARPSWTKSTVSVKLPDKAPELL